MPVEKPVDRRRGKTLKVQNTSGTTGWIWQLQSV